LATKCRHAYSEQDKKRRRRKNKERSCRGAEKRLVAATMSYDQILSPLFGAGRSAWRAAGGGDAVTRQILKCTRWQLEETTDFVTCPYH